MVHASNGLSLPSPLVHTLLTHILGVMDDMPGMAPMRRTPQPQGGGFTSGRRAQPLRAFDGELTADSAPASRSGADARFAPAGMLVQLEHASGPASDARPRVPFASFMSTSKPGVHGMRPDAAGPSSAAAVAVEPGLLLSPDLPGLPPHGSRVGPAHTPTSRPFTSRHNTPGASLAASSISLASSTGVLESKEDRDAPPHPSRMHTPAAGGGQQQQQQQHLRGFEPRVTFDDTHVDDAPHAGSGLFSAPRTRPRGDDASLRSALRGTATPGATSVPGSAASGAPRSRARVGTPRGTPHATPQHRSNGVVEGGVHGLESPVMHMPDGSERSIFRPKPSVKRNACTRLCLYLCGCGGQ